jgi:hypothetical protein
MARLKLSALVNAIDGSMSGTTFQQGTSGQIMRNKPRPSNPRSIGQNNLRNITGQVLRKWQYLTNAEKTAWSSFAIYLNKAQKNNSKKILTGQSIFTEINVTRLLFSLAYIITPVYNAGRLLNTVFGLYAGVDSVSIESSRVPDTAIEFIELFCTPPLSYGLQSPPNKYRLVIFPTTELESIEITTQYQAIFQALAVEKSKIFWKARLVDVTSGISSPWQYGVNYWES